MKKYLTLLIVFVNITFYFFGVGTSGYAETNNQPEVIVENISYFQKKPKISHTIQPIPMHVANLTNYLTNASPQISSLDVMKYIYPSTPSEDLKNMSADFDKSLSYFNSQKFTFRKQKGIPDYSVIVDEIKAQRPLLVHLKVNSDYWLEPGSTVLIYGIQVFKLPDGSANILYMCRSYNHSDLAIFSGSENKVDLLSKEKEQDPTIKTIDYSWVETAYGFKR